MSVAGVLILQMCIPFILYSIEELFVFRVDVNVTISIEFCGLIFCIITVLNVHKRLPILGNQTKASIVLVLSHIFASSLLSGIFKQRSLLNIFAHIVCCVLWTNFWIFFDNSLKNVTVYLRRRWIRIFEIFLQWFIWIMFFSLIGYCIRGVFNPLKCFTAMSSRTNFVNIHDAELPRFNTLVDSIETKNEDDWFNIRYDIGENQSNFQISIELPVCNRIYERYIGEDVKMECKLPIEFNTAINYQSKWIHDSKELTNSHKKKITSIRGTYIIETLSIYLIDRDDFGKYQLWVSRNLFENDKTDFYKVNYMVSLNVLTKLADLVKYINVPVGNGLFLNTQIDNVFETDVLDLKFTIESTLVGSTSVENNSKRIFYGCSLFSYFFLQTAKTFVDPNYDINKPSLGKISNKEISVKAFLCTTELSYGKHSIHIIRDFYNETTKMKQNVTTPLRLTYIVLPDKSYNIYNKDYEQYRAMRFEDADKSDLLDEVRIWLTRQILEILLFFLGVFTFLTICKYLICLLNKHLVSAICKYISRLAGFRVERSSDACLGNIYNGDKYGSHYEYDIFILSTENDMAFIAENDIIIGLEDRKYRVCVPERDFKAGSSMFQLFSKAVQHSKTIIVVCSIDFMEDPFMNTIVFGDFIMAISVDGKIDNKNIILIKKDDCCIPTVLKRKYDFLDYTEMFQTNGCIKTLLCAWVETKIPRFKYNTNFLFWDVMMLLLISSTLVIVVACLILTNIGNLFFSPSLSTCMLNALSLIVFDCCYLLVATIDILLRLRLIYIHEQRLKAKCT